MLFCSLSYVPGPISTGGACLCTLLDREVVYVLNSVLPSRPPAVTSRASRETEAEEKLSTRMVAAAEATRRWWLLWAWWQGSRGVSGWQVCFVGGNKGGQRTLKSWAWATGRIDLPASGKGEHGASSRARSRSALNTARPRHSKTSDGVAGWIYTSLSGG